VAVAAWLVQRANNQQAGCKSGYAGYAGADTDAMVAAVAA
jgi:hypothetical protein